MIRKTRQGRSGFTILEIAAVLGLISILSIVAHGSVRKLLPRYRMIQVAKELRNDIHALRFTAIEMNREVRLTLVEPDEQWDQLGTWSVGEWHLQVGNKPLRSSTWDTLPADGAENGSDVATGRGRVQISWDGEDEVRGVSLKPWEELAGPASGNDDSIVFSPRGWVINPASDFGSDGYIHITLVNKAALGDGIDDTVDIKVARSGLVRMESSLGPEDTTESVGTGLNTGRGS